MVNELRNSCCFDDPLTSELSPPPTPYTNRVGRKTYTARAGCPGETWPEEPLVGAGPPPSNGAGPLRHRHAAARGFCSRAIHICFSPLRPPVNPPVRFTVRARVSPPPLGRSPPPSSRFSPRTLPGLRHTVFDRRPRRNVDASQPPPPQSSARAHTHAPTNAAASFRCASVSGSSFFKFFRYYRMVNNIVETVASSFSHVGFLAPSAANVYTETTGTDRANRR